LEASPQTQAAADVMALWYGVDALHLLKPGPGVVIRPWPKDALTAAEADYDHARAQLDAVAAEARALGPALAELNARVNAYAATQAQAPTTPTAGKPSGRSTPGTDGNTSLVHSRGEACSNNVPAEYAPPGRVATNISTHDVSADTPTTEKENTIMAKKSNGTPTGFGGGANKPGGPKGRAPYSRGPTVAAVTPKAGASRNPGSSAPVRTGGGEGSAKHIKRPQVGGSASVRKTSPYGTGHIGSAIGDKAMDSGGQPLRRGDPSLYQPAKAIVPHGNTITTNVGKGGPGTGRTVHAKGSQAFYGNDANLPGTINRDGSISSPGSNQGTSIRGTADRSSPFLNGAKGGQGPGSFGFRGGK
jgi:hypothetical protein